MKLLYGHDEAVAEWVGEKLEAKMWPPCVSIGVLDHHGTLVGGIVYNQFHRGGNIEVAVYGPRAFGRDVIKLGFAYPFVQLGVARITIRTRRSNHLMRRLAPKLGFTLECVQARFFGPTKADDAFVYRLFRNDCRWI